MAYLNLYERRTIWGNKRVVTSLGIVGVIGDTYDTRLRVIENVQVTSTGVNATGVNAFPAAGVITFSGAAGPVSVLAVGY